MAGRKTVIINFFEVNYLAFLWVFHAGKWRRNLRKRRGIESFVSEKIYHDTIPSTKILDSEWTPSPSVCRQLEDECIYGNKGLHESLLHYSHLVLRLHRK